MGIGDIAKKGKTFRDNPTEGERKAVREGRAMYTKGSVAAMAKKLTSSKKAPPKKSPKTLPLIKSTMKTMPKGTIQKLKEKGKKFDKALKNEPVRASTGGK